MTVRYSLEELKKLWEELGDVPGDDYGYTQEPFMDFGTGTDREDIWHWFDERCPRGLVPDIINGG